MLSPLPNDKGQNIGGNTICLAVGYSMIFAVACCSNNGNAIASTLQMMKW